MTTTNAVEFLATAASALERMAFVITEPGPETSGEVLVQPCWHASIEISGDEHRAWLVVSATRGFVAEVAASMMGMEPDEIDADEHGEATVAELANVLGGELVMAMGGDVTPLRLSLPHQLDDHGAMARIDEIAGSDRGWTTVLKSESGLLLIACRTH
jgi:CheY-specific phosphatase CheX